MSSALDQSEGWRECGGPQDVFYKRDPDWPFPIIVGGEGVALFGEDGERYLDVSSGPVASNLGHGHPRIIEAIRRQAQTLSFAYARVARTRENIRLSERLTTWAGEGFERCFLVSGGSEAMDMAIKFARQVAFARGQRQRTRLFSLMRSYHGGTLATLAVSGDKTLEGILEGIAVSSEKIPAPLSYRPPDGLTPEQNEARVLALFERRLAELGPETVLAMLVEPVGGLASGANVLSAQFLAAIAEVCRRHGIFLIFDESGAGRTGTFLGAHRHPRARPDLVVLAKGLSGGYAPLGAMLAPAALVDPLAEKRGFNYAHTANANPISCAVGLAVLEELERGQLVRHAEALGAYLRGRLLDMARRVPVIGDVRGQGLLMAVEIVADQAGRTPLPGKLNAPSSIRRIGLDHGLMIYARRTNNGRFGDWFMLSPPLVTERQEADEMVWRLERTLIEFTDAVVRAGVRVST